MMYKITSIKTGADLVTQDPMKDVAWANEFYITDDCVRVVMPEPVLPTANDLRILQIDALLTDIDRKSIRPLRAGETNRLAELDAQAITLRSERAGLV